MITKSTQLKATAHLYERWDGEPDTCAYCGAPADGVDYLPPLEAAYRRLRSSTEGRYFIVDSCEECSKIRDHLPPETIDEKRALIARTYAKRYAGVLRRPEWTAAELAELGPDLRRRVENGMSLRDAMASRMRVLSAGTAHPLLSRERDEAAIALALDRLEDAVATVEVAWDGAGQQRIGAISIEEESQTTLRQLLEEALEDRSRQLDLTFGGGAAYLLALHAGTFRTRESFDRSRLWASLGAGAVHATRQAELEAAVTAGARDIWEIEPIDIDGTGVVAALLVEGGAFHEELIEVLRNGDERSLDDAGLSDADAALAKRLEIIERARRTLRRVGPAPMPGLLERLRGRRICPLWLTGATNESDAAAILGALVERGAA